MTQCLCGNVKIFPATVNQATPHLTGCPADPKFDVTKAALECAGRSISIHVRQLAGAWPDEAGKTAQAWILIVELLGFRQGPPDSDGIPMPVSRFEPAKRWREVGGRFLCVDPSTGKLLNDANGRPVQVDQPDVLLEIVAELVRERDRAAPPVAPDVVNQTAAIAEILQQVREVVATPAPPGAIKLHAVPPAEQVVRDEPATVAETWRADQLRAELANATHVIAYDVAGMLHREPIIDRETDGVPSAHVFRFPLGRPADGIQWAFVNHMGLPIWCTEWRNMSGMPPMNIQFDFRGIITETPAKT